VPLYASAYAGFSAREEVRRQTYGDDLGQSGWLTVDELERFAEWLDLGAETRLLDVGCGAGGPALRLAETIGLTVVGVDILAEGIATATQLARERGLEGRASFLQVARAGRFHSRMRASTRLSPSMRCVTSRIVSASSRSCTA
jgi:2-polyprenyl-3-methyl-5-hydroxy-6-metoxy-1,4-benzoquinol methylase